MSKVDKWAVEELLSLGEAHVLQQVGEKPTECWISAFSENI